jgi:hypothetical protein
MAVGFLKAKGIGELMQGEISIDDGMNAVRLDSANHLLLLTAVAASAALYHFGACMIAQSL